MSRPGTRATKKRLALVRDLGVVARRVIWFEPPEQSLADTNRFLAYLMTYGTPADVLAARRHFSLDDMRTALENAPPGIFDPQSWAYWNLVTGRDPDTPMPIRRLPD